MSIKLVTRKNKPKGMTLLEVIIVLGIMGVIAAGVVVLAQRAIDSQNVTKLSQSLNTIQTAMIQSFRGKSNYPEAGTAAQTLQLRNALVSMGRASAQDFINPFTGDFLDIETTEAMGVANKAFAIRISDLTQEQCRSIITSVSDVFAFIQVGVAGVALADDVHTNAVAGAATGVGILKSTNGGGNQFRVTVLDHITNLCGVTGAGAANTYDVWVGSR